MSAMLSRRGAPPKPPDRAHRDEETPRRVVRGRLGTLSVRATMVAGGWIGFGLGLVVGALIGALLCWFADAVLQWQHDLGLTLGVAQNLLPLGDQVGTLRTISHEWYLVIPIAAFIGGLIFAMLGGLVAGLVAVGYNHASRRVAVIVEFSDPDGAHERSGTHERAVAHEQSAAHDRPAAHEQSAVDNAGDLVPTASGPGAPSGGPRHIRALPVPGTDGARRDDGPGGFPGN